MVERLETPMSCDAAGRDASPKRSSVCSFFSRKEGATADVAHALSCPKQSLATGGNPRRATCVVFLGQRFKGPAMLARLWTATGALLARQCDTPHKRSCGSFRRAMLWDHGVLTPGEKVKTAPLGPCHRMRMSGQKINHHCRLGQGRRLPGPRCIRAPTNFAAKRMLPRPRRSL
ncbi:hypothetical protein BDU57DRAFT_49936 [Ampelomyces quisqualis]|uniref:Uncharacterized protein n=1 Tax=Ampelomyces quisqualis TaxID=50730 RepID=A0A6A5R1A8_AMPQU|nr:hypothetical protein BDU57DRAFT_49936 [Ampelomyces quisqualis]